MLVPAFDHALRQVAGWRKAGHSIPVLHLFMSRSLLLTPSVVDRISWMLDDNGIEPEQIALEISERYCGGRGGHAVFANLRRLADLGAGIVVDDFGSVNAALGNIVSLPAETIKIDVGRAEGLSGSTAVQSELAKDGMRNLLHGLVRVGNSLGVSVLAKRVSNVR